MGLEPRSSDAFKRTAEHAVRSNQTLALQPLSAALPDLSLISAPGRRQKWAALREAVGVTPAEWLSQHQNRRSALSGAKVKVDQRPQLTPRNDWNTPSVHQWHPPPKPAFAMVTVHTSVQFDAWLCADHFSDRRQDACASSLIPSELWLAGAERDAPPSDGNV